jgi:uncharacterized coiled-coil protein SlyX
MDDVNNRLNRIEIRLARLDATLAQIDKRVSDGFAVVNARLEGLENRLSHKAEKWVVSLGGATLGILVGAAFALIKLMP